MADKKSQNEQVLEYMRRNGSITQKQAADELDIYRLSARIYDLIALGVAIIKETRHRYDESGKVVKTWTEYRLA